MDLLERLAHFEKYQLEDGDEYGAEVLHKSSAALRLLVEVGKAAKSHRWHQTHHGGPHYTSAPSELESKAKVRKWLDNAIATALANPDCAALLGGNDDGNV